MGSRTARFILLFVVSSALGCGAGPGGGIGGDDDGGGSSGLDGGGGGGGLDGDTPPGLDGASGGLDAGGDLPPDDEERCNGADDNGDGRVDEGCACVIGSTQPCYPGDRDVAGVGACTLGTQVCIETGVEFGAWGACTGAEPPGEETCDGTDDDCDGFVDDGCECDPSETRPCYTGPFGTEGVGECAAGVQACEPGPGGVGSMFGACMGDVTPSASEACDGVDDDCDGAVDDGCACSPGDTRACYTGAPGTDGVGPCRAGAQACVDDGTGTLGWGACAGAVLPGADSCNGADDDCDGTVDEGCSCAPGDTRPCYGGPAGTGDVGACRGGTQTCEPGPGGVGSAWSGCAGERVPSMELCNGIDDDCDGLLDEGCTCTPGSTSSCYTGPAGSDMIAPCRAGTRACITNPDGTTSWGACTGEVLPMTDVCGDGLDQSCDGVVDDTCACPPSTTRSCYDGPGGTAGIGRCRAGSQMCVLSGTSASWTGCSGQVLPGAEACNGLDDDCDGVDDDGCDCVPGSSRACYDGPAGTRGIGRCTDGSQLCAAGPGGIGAGWGTCGGWVGPGTETCNGVNDDCDSMVDEGVCMVPPTVTCPPPATTRPLVPVSLSGSASDADGVIVSWAWTLVSAPAGATGTFSAASSPTTNFTPNLVGVYTVRLTVTDDDGLTATCTTTVTATGDGIRIEMLWNTDRSDVDLHLLRMAGGQPWWTADDCRWNLPRPSWDAAGTADDPRLDIDDVEGYGPENINIDVPVTGSTYRVGAHYWDADGAGASSVTVRIYCGDISTTPRATYTRTLNASGIDGPNDFWRVADVRWDGGDSCTVTAVNTMTTGTGSRTMP